jgi:integrase
MPLDEVPRLLASLSAYDGEGRTKLALRLAILTFVRATELRAARCSEFEALGGDEPLWRIPSERMKIKLEHIVPP